MQKKNSRSAYLAMLFLLAGSGITPAHATNLQLAVQMPLFDAPGISAPASTSTALGSFGNFFANLYERLGVYAALYPVNAGPLHIGAALDAMWHYDIDVDRTPALVGYNHVGLAATGILDLGPSLHARAAFGLNRMGSRTGNENGAWDWGSVLEAGLGFDLGAGGTGFFLEGLFQNRTGLFATRYGVLRLGFGF